MPIAASLTSQSKSAAQFQKIFARASAGTSSDAISARMSVPGTAKLDRKSTRLNSSHGSISYAVFCLKKKTEKDHHEQHDRRPGQRAGDGGPADQRREAAGEPATDDVLGRAQLAQHRVAEHVEVHRGH